MKITTLTTIIVTFNSERYITNCVESLFKNKFSLKHEILIIDNDSKDGTKIAIENIKKTYRNVSAIYNHKNLGFSKAVNIGLKCKATSELFLLINPDTIISNNSIGSLITCANDTKAGIVGGNTINKAGRLSGCYFRFPNFQIGLFDFTNLRKLSSTDYWHRWFYYLDRDYSKLNHFPVEVVTGGFMLIRKTVLDTVGYFNEKYFMYLEDVDFCLRAYKKGIRVYHCNNAETIHFGGGSSQNKNKTRQSSWIISRKIYFLSNFGLIPNIIIQLVFLFDDLIIILKENIPKIK